MRRRHCHKDSNTHPNRHKLLFLQDVVCGTNTECFFLFSVKPCRDLSLLFCFLVAVVFSFLIFWMKIIARLKAPQGTSPQDLLQHNSGGDRTHFLSDLCKTGQSDFPQYWLEPVGSVFQASDWPKVHQLTRVTGP